MSAIASPVNDQGSASPVEEVRLRGKAMAIIVRAQFREPGIHFFTPNDYSQQLGYMRHPAGKQIVPHFHNIQPRKVNQTQEVLFIRSGVLRVDFYETDGAYLESRLLHAGDVILLASEGHGFQVIEDIEMIEVKQGPYNADEDKVRMAAVPEEDIVLP